MFGGEESKRGDQYLGGIDIEDSFYKLQLLFQDDEMMEKSE